MKNFPEGFTIGFGISKSLSLGTSFVLTIWLPRSDQGCCSYKLPLVPIQEEMQISQA